jgi:ABC-type glycerol-3-phosphate transport system substrate-binding protein
MKKVIAIILLTILCCFTLVACKQTEPDTDTITQVHFIDIHTPNSTNSAENQINSWLQENPNIEVVDIKFEIEFSSYSSDYWVMIVYKTAVD